MLKAGTLRSDGNDRAVRALCMGYGIVILLALVLPLAALLRRSVLDADGVFVGLHNYIAYASSPVLLQSFGHSVLIAGLTSLIVVPLALAFGLALARTRMPGKGFFRAIALVPLLMPGILKAIALVYLFGNQGIPCAAC